MDEEELAIRQWLADWYDWCDWLQRQPSHCSYQTPERLLYLREGAGSSGLVVYHSGWGWRLRKGWLITWAYLVAEYLIVPVGGPFITMFERKEIQCEL